MEIKNSHLEPVEQKPKKVKIKKGGPPKQSAEDYMAYLNMQGSSRFGV